MNPSRGFNCSRIAGLFCSLHLNDKFRVRKGTVKKGLGGDGKISGEKKGGRREGGRHWSWLGRRPEENG